MEMYDIERQRVEQNSRIDQIRRYIEEDSKHEDLHKVELHLFRQILALGLEFLKEVIARRGSGKTTTWIAGKQGKQFRYHGLRKRIYLSIFGQIDIVRAYYRTDQGEGFYPLDGELNLPSIHISYLLQRWTQSEIAETTYDHAIEHINDFLGIKLWKRGQEDAVRERVTDLDAFYLTKPPPEASSEGSMICVTADCTGVRMVPAEKPEPCKGAEKGKFQCRDDVDKHTGLHREAVVVSNFTFHPASRTAEEVVESLLDDKKCARNPVKHKAKKKLKSGRHCDPQTRSQHLREPLNKQTFAFMDGKKVAFSGLLDLVDYRDPEGSKPIYALLDGDQALKNRLLEEIKLRGWEHRLTGICLDIIHVMEYVKGAAKALYGKDEKQRVAWVRKIATSLLQGHVGRVIGGLKQRAEKAIPGSYKWTELRRVIGYFKNHREMMAYDRFLAAGYPIATGVIEGACGSLVKNRTDGSGMRWTKN